MLLFFITDADILQHSHHIWKTILQFDEEAYNMEFCTNLGHWNSQKTWICSQAAICIPRKTLERVLCHRLVYWDDCKVIWILRTTWCSRRAAHRNEQQREFVLINHRQSSNLDFRTLCAEN